MKSDFPSRDSPAPAAGRLGFAPLAPASAGNRSEATDINRLPQSDELAALAVKISAARATRKDLFPPTLFGEPGWDMLLALYHTSCSGSRLTVSNLCQFSQAPDTTALRWIDRLVELELVRRRPNPLDARVIFIELEPSGRSKIEDYLIQTWILFY